MKQQERVRGLGASQPSVCEAQRRRLPWGGSGARAWQLRGAQPRGLPARESPQLPAGTAAFPAPAGPVLTGAGTQPRHPSPAAGLKGAAHRRGSGEGGGRRLRGPRAGRCLPPGAAHSYPVSQGGAAGCGVPRPRALAAPRRDSQRRAPLGSRLLFACRGCEWRARPAGPWHGGGVSAPSAGRARRRRSLKPHWGAARPERPLRFARLHGECGAGGTRGGWPGGASREGRSLPG